MKNRKTSFYVYAFIMLLPFVLFYWMIPFVTSRTIGNDYLHMLRMQMELLFSIRTHSFPLYVPGFASGHSSAALTLGQMFYPVSYIASLFPGYWEGKLIDVNNLFKLLSLGFAHMVSFMLLKKVKINTVLAFVISLAAVYNLRIPDLYRYGPALDTYAAQFILYASIVWYFTRPENRFAPLSVIVSTYLVICSGHPQMMYYALLGAGLFAVVFPFFAREMIPDESAVCGNVAGFWLKTGFLLLLGVMLSSAYILPFYFDFLSFNVARVGQQYEWALENVDTVIGTVNNFFLPLRSEAHSAFGGSALILMSALLPVTGLLGVKIPRSIWIVWGLFVLIVLYMQGHRTPLHRLSWEYLPLASSFRIPGRISMIIPVFLMLMLAWIVRVDSPAVRLNRWGASLRPAAVLALIVVCLTALYYLSYLTGYYILDNSVFQTLFHPYYAHSFENIPYFWVELAVVVLGIISLAALTYHTLQSRPSRAVTVILALSIIMQMCIALKYRSAIWIEKKYVSPAFEEISRQKSESLEYLHYPGGGMHSSVVARQLERSFMEPFLGKIFTQVVPVENQKEAYGKMERSRLPHQVFIEGYGPDMADKINERAEGMKEGSVELVYSSFNRLTFLADSETAAIFGLSYPYTGHWNAWINGEESRVFRANGAAHAVEIPAGMSVIEFRYWSSASFWGMFISFMTLTAVGLFFAVSTLNGRWRNMAAVIILVTCAGGFALWYQSLYGGDNLQTEYAWTYRPPLKTPNLAYGKKNWLGPSATSAHWKFRHTEWHYRQIDRYVSRFVDGCTSPGSGFSTRLSNGPDWFVDLSNVETIRKILLYESVHDPSINSDYSTVPAENVLVNVRPIRIYFSSDGNEWHMAALIREPMHSDEPLTVSFKEPQTARYIRIQATGKSALSFDEVEVYGPAHSE